MTTTQTTTGAGGGSTGSSSAQAQWSDLPDDILGNIRLKIASLRDRVRLAAVCRPWRAAAARLPAPPAIPVLLLSWTGETKHLCGGGPDDSWVLRIPDKAAHKRLIGSHEGGWVAAFDFGTWELTLLNLFSGAEVGVCSPWSADQWDDIRYPITRVILSDDPNSSRGCILAIIDLNKIALCKVGCRSGWTKHGCGKQMFRDIAFCNGDLYGLAWQDEELVRFELGMEEGGSPIVTSTHQLAIQRQHGPVVYDCYLVELHGKPSKAIMSRWLPNREPYFKVFELVDADTSKAYQYKWVEVTSFGDYALFLGPGKSKAVHVPRGAERRGFERNHIYHSNAIYCRESELPGNEVYSMRSKDGRNLSCRKHQSVGDGLERTGYYLMGSENDSMWLHPPNL